MREECTIPSFESHFRVLRRWIDLEGEAERQRMAERLRTRSSVEAEKRGETLLDLVIVDEQAGLGGRVLATLVKRNRTLGLPWNRFRIGSPIVATSQDGDEETTYGVVCGKNQQSIQIAFDDFPTGTNFRIDLSADEVSRARQLTALQTIQHARGRIAQMREILMNEREPQFGPRPALDLDSGLNDSQKDAIHFAMSAHDVAIIHGPPGTGKTTTIVELIRQAVLRGERVFATAPSNTAVDNMLDRMAKFSKANSIRLVRIGHPARVHEGLQQYSLDALVENDPTMELVRDLMKQAEQVARKADRFTRGRPAPGAKQELRRESRQLREDAKNLERQVIASILDRADVLCATTSFDPEVLGDRTFDLAVIDEACQSTEPGCWPVIPRAHRLVLAGDHCQLPPTVLSSVAAKEGFSVSLMERLVRTYGETITKRLSVQYRMHQQIMAFSSKRFYDETLIAHPSVANHRLCDLCPSSSDELIEGVASFIDTSGTGWEEELEPEGESRRNPAEGRFLLSLADAIVEHGVRPEEIAIIAPYSAQVRWLRDHSRHHGIEIDTVDGFQGREKEAVLISLVRSNDSGEIGFLSDERRMNVALTRSKRRLIVVGDSGTLAKNAFYSDLLSYFDSIGGYSSVWQYPQHMP